jgi:hypothetical protein
MKTLVIEKIYNKVKELTPEDMNKFSGRIIFYYIKHRNQNYTKRNDFYIGKHFLYKNNVSISRDNVFIDYESFKVVLSSISLLDLQYIHLKLTQT